MKYIITGSSGFLASHLINRLKKDGHEIIGWDIKEGNDVCDPNLTAENINGIFHFACPVDPAHYEKVAVPTLLASSVGTYNMLEIAKINKAKFLYVSSSEVYGESNNLPYREDDPGIVDTKNPRSYYGESKRFGEMQTMVYHRYLGLDVRIIRPFNIYGQGMRYDDSRVIPSFFRNKKEGRELLVNDSGESTRTFCYVGDFTEAVARAMFYDKTNGEVFNIGSQESVTMLELARIIDPNVKTLKSTRVGEQKHRRPDINKVKEILNWEPITSLKDGLEKMWKSYQ